MNLKTIFLSLFIIGFISTLFSGCGYKPSSYYAKKQINGKVFSDTIIDIENTEASVLIKDTINSMLINQFDAILVEERESADFIINAELMSVKSKALQTDNDGYSLVYRITVVIDIVYYRNNLNSKKNIIQVINYDDYIITDDSIKTEQNKIKAIKTASSKALSNLFSKISLENFAK